MLETIVERLRVLTDDVFIVAPPDRRYDRFGVPVLSEPDPGQGPLGGIEIALASAGNDRCLVVACDLPFLNPVLIEWMMRYSFDGDALVPVVPRDAAGKLEPQPLHAIYDRSSLEAVRRQLAGGHRRVGDLLDQIRVTYLAAEELRRHDQDLMSFFNLNRSADRQEAERLARMLRDRTRAGETR